MIMKYRWMVGGVMIAAALTSAMVGHPRTRDSVERPPDVVEVRGRVAIADDADRRLEARGTLFPAHAEQLYDLYETAQVVTSTGQQLLAVTLRGQLTLLGLSSAPTVRVLGTFRGTFEAHAEDAAQPLSELAQRPFVLEFAQDGTLLAAHGDPDVPRLIARLWTALGESLQLTGESAEDAWESRERDAAGAYRAGYQRAGADVMLKRKLRYEGPPARGLAKYEVTSSQARLTRDAEGRLDALALDETVRAEAAPGNPMPGFQGTTQLQLVRSGVTQRGDLSAQLAQVAGSVRFDVVGAKQDEAARDEARIGGLSVAATLERLASLRDAATPEARARAGRAFVAFSALLRRDPRALRAAQLHLRSGDSLAVVVLAGLRDAGTEDAQRALIAAIRGRDLSAELRLEAARALSHVAAPSGETLTALEALRADDVVGTQASYGLGSALYRLRNLDAALAKRARGALTQQLRTASEPGAQSVALTALGNAGDPETFSLVRGFVGASSEPVRAAAIQALRRMPLVDVEPLLVGACRDPASAVRFSAVDVIHERVPSEELGRALATIALQEPDYQVRARAVNVLAKWLPDVPSVADSLARVAATDANADLRNVSKNALARATL